MAKAATAKAQEADKKPEAPKAEPAPRRAFHKKGGLSLTSDSMSWPSPGGKAAPVEVGFFEREYRWQSDNDTSGVSHGLKVRVLRRDDTSDLADMSKSAPACTFCLRRQFHSTELCKYMRSFCWPPKEDA